MNIFNDWIIIDNMNINGFSKIIRKSIKNTNPICIDSKSTTGGKAKQYDLFNYIKNNFIIDKVKETILLNLESSLKLKLKNLKLLSAWTVLGYEHSYHSLHKHNERKNHIASVLYLNVPPSKRIKRDGTFFYVYKKNQEINYGSHEPKIGDLIIFPVWLWHGAYPQSKGLRQTLNLDFEICQ